MRVWTGHVRCRSLCCFGLWVWKPMKKSWNSLAIPRSRTIRKTGPKLLKPWRQHWKKTARPIVKKRWSSCIKSFVPVNRRRLKMPSNWLNRLSLTVNVTTWLMWVVISWIKNWAGETGFRIVSWQNRWLTRKPAKSSFRKERWWLTRCWIKWKKARFIKNTDFTSWKSEN